MATAAELRDLDRDELASRLAEARQELFNLRFQAVTGQLDNTARLGQLRREVARVLTVMREREIEADAQWHEAGVEARGADEGGTAQGSAGAQDTGAER